MLSTITPNATMVICDILFCGVDPKDYIISYLKEIFERNFFKYSLDFVIVFCFGVCGGGFNAWETIFTFSFIELKLTLSYFFSVIHGRWSSQRVRRTSASVKWTAAGGLSSCAATASSSSTSSRPRPRAPCNALGRLRKTTQYKTRRCFN